VSALNTLVGAIWSSSNEVFPLTTFAPVFAAEDVDYSLGGQSSERARAENRALLEELDRRKGARSLAVPTDDTKVRARLRELEHPITLFGERVC